jgi:hypothetical protein
MSKKLCLLISFVLLLGLVSNTSAQVKFQYRASWWSDLGPGHLWSEPNNWWTMDRYYVDLDDSNSRGYGEPMWYVKQPNQVPDINCAAIIGKGGAREVYPRALRELILDGHVMTDPTLDTGVGVAAWLQCGGGESFDPNVGGGALDPDANHDDPCRHHDFWMTGGELTLGEPQTWDGYDYVYYDGMFYGQWASGRISIAAAPWGAAGASGTMHMSGGTVNVGGHIGVGSWGATGLLDMTGGTINITQGLYSSVTYWGSSGQVNLHGGTINAKYFTIQNGSGSSGSIDITEGKMVLERNEVQKLQDYHDAVEASATITVYGGSHGDIDPCTGLRVALSIDYDVSSEAKTTVQTFLTDPNQAWAPSPPNGAGSVKGTIANIARPVLSWSPGDGAVSHEVYFSASKTLVDSRSPSVLKQSAYDPCSWTVDSDLTSFGTYYWAIDENPGPTLGQVWSFTMANLSKASLPSPENGATEVNPVVVLGWAAGVMASTHDVYFSTDFNDVNDRSISPDNTGANNSYDPPGNGLDFSTLYYWRVDECNAAGGPEWPGDVWSFTTHDRIIVETFDSYANDEAIKAVWLDYWNDTGSKNGGQVFVETNPDLVQDGKSMKYQYKNYQKVSGKYAGSWAEAATTDLAAGTDWTASDVKVLTVYFLGDPCNGKDTSGLEQDQMYVELVSGSDFGLIEYPDMNAVTEGFWHEWNIALQDFNDVCGVTLSSVDTVRIGFGGFKKTGQASVGAGGSYGYPDTVYFEDIELWPPKCVTSVARPYGDFTDDCVIDLDDAEVMFDAWMMTDYNTVGYAGTFRGFTSDPCDPNYDVCWVSPGRIGSYALEFGVGHILTDPCCTSSCYGIHEPELDDDVLIPPLELNTNTVTFTCWVKSHGPQWPDTALFHSDGANGEFTGDTVVGWDVATYGAPAIPELPPNEWAFCALVIAPEQVTMYIKKDSDPCNLLSDSTGNSHDPEPFDIPGQIGSHKWRWFDGLIDDFRIYDYSLSLDQIKHLAFEGNKGTEPSPAPFSWYEFDDGSGLSAEDSGGGGIIYHDVPSIANLYNEEEPYERIVNFRDYRMMADNWLEVKMWPEP